RRRLRVKKTAGVAGGAWGLGRVDIGTTWAQGCNASPAGALPPQAPNGPLSQQGTQGNESRRADRRIDVELRERFRRATTPAATRRSCSAATRGAPSGSLGPSDVVEKARCTPHAARSVARFTLQTENRLTKSG